jgi:small subunit ribosomal protein S11
MVEGGLGEKNVTPRRAKKTAESKAKTVEVPAALEKTSSTEMPNTAGLDNKKSGAKRRPMSKEEVKEESKELEKTEAKKEENTQQEEKKGEIISVDNSGPSTPELKIRRAKGSKNISVGICHVLATFNNTKVTFTDTKGGVIAWSSSGRCNFKGSRKSTAYAAQIVTTEAGKIAMGHGLKEISVHVKGPGIGRDAAVRTLQTLGLNVSEIVDVTPVPHNGCRPPKRRRP